MIEAVSCGGVVIFRGKILLLYKKYHNKSEGWVLPKGTVEAGEEHKETAVREVFEESGARARIVKYIGTSEYSFTVPEDVVEKEVHWYLMTADSYFTKPQREVLSLFRSFTSPSFTFIPAIPTIPKHSIATLPAYCAITS